MKKIFITGGCGFIGSNLISYLLKKNVQNISVYDNETIGKSNQLEEFNVDFIHGDICDKNKLKEAMKDADSIVHLAADTRVIDSIGNPIHNFNSNVLGTLNVLENMRELKIKRLVNASTGGAIMGEVTPPINESMPPNPISPYGASKLAAEGYCSAYAGSYDITAISLRFSNVYGPRSFYKGSVVAHFLKRILDNEDLVVYGNGKQKRDYVFVDDICEGIYNALRIGEKGVYQLGTGMPTSINELIKLIKKTIGENDNLKINYEDFREGEIRNTWCDITKAKKLINYQPKITLDVGLSRTWKWFLNFYKGKK